ncbi:MAG TPA: sialidase family protein, partial [Candidatus Polarisedimenticolaceae bacterium]|nr:sialidase family protein [Candidatus Polarisedimenticolaceae bacterium]
NPTGDFTGDLWPNIAESPLQAHWPWVTWSKFNGADYDLVWSRWTGRGWTPVVTVEGSPGTDDALDSSIAFDQVGRPYLVWVSKPRNGVSRVNVSMFLSTRWMGAFAVSDAFENATDPTISLTPDGNIVVTYETEAGPVTRQIRVTRPWTITDDITPFGTLSIADPRPTGPLNP